MLGTIAILFILTIIAVLPHQPIPGIDFSTCLLSLVCVSLLFTLSLLRRDQLPGAFLIVFYLLIATLSSLAWGVSHGLSILLYAFSILLSGILFRRIGIVAVVCIAILCLFVVQSINIHQGFSKEIFVTSYITTAIHIIFLTSFALTGWLFAQNIDYVTNLAKEKNIFLAKQRVILTEALALQKEELRQVQIKEMTNLYDFVELGQHTTIILQDLANHFTNLSLDFSEKALDNKMLSNIKKQLSEIESVITLASTRLHNTQRIQFRVSKYVRKTVEKSKLLAHRSDIELSFRSHIKSVTFLYGDPFRLQQIIDILITNAIQSYEYAPKENERTVYITVTQTDQWITIRVRDNGVGLTLLQRRHIFTSISSTKKHGHGLGLYISQKIVENHFGGTLTISEPLDYTEFCVKLPIGQILLPETTSPTAPSSSVKA